MIEVHGDERSGNCLKVKWVLDYLGRPYRWHHVDILNGEARTKSFLTMNPAGQVPVVCLEGGRVLAQSNAIVLYFIQGTRLTPQDAFDRARMLEWLFWEQYSHEPYVAVRRFQRLYLGRADEEIDSGLIERGTKALRRMEHHLRAQDWLAGEQPSAADLCLLPYTMLAGEGGFDLAGFPRLDDWISRTSSFFGVARPSTGDAS
jgi:glutathione S-transferase